MCTIYYATETGDSRIWTRSVCFASIRRGTKTGASLFFLFFIFLIFLSPVYFPCGQKFFSAESQFHCRGNLRFREQFPCLVQRLKECWLDSDVCLSSGAVWESRWTSWAVRPNEPSGFRRRKELLNRASALGGGENLCLMSSDVLRHIRDKLYETLNTNLREKLVGCKTVYFGLVHLCRGDPCQDLGGKLNLEIWCPSGLKICILFSSKVKIYIKMRIKTFLGPV